MRDYAAAQDIARRVLVRKYPTLRNDVEDIVQDAAVKAILHEDQYKGGSKWETWFTSIAIREALIRLRAGSRVQWCELTDVHQSSSSDPEGDAARAERAVRLHTAARRLPRALRLEFPRYLAGDTCLENNRKNARFRIRERLRVALEGIV